MDYYIHIKKVIEEQILEGNKEFIIFPYGEQGYLTKKILNESYVIQEKYIIDNHLSKFNPEIKDVAFLSMIDCRKYKVLITSDNKDIYEEIREIIKQYMPEENIIDLFSKERIEKRGPKKTEVGKYSYGPLCDHWLVESVGAFCCFGPETEVVGNHAMNYISMHPFLYDGIDKENGCIKGEEWYLIDKEDEKRVLLAPSYFPGVNPRGKRDRFRRITIGNDVWLGRRVIVTNGSNIGNGVIAGAGAVITKNVPDYAVVGGVPARIIRYRYTPEQIKALNQIAWWDWPDEKIREYYNDFYLSVEEFIKKHNIN